MVSSAISTGRGAAVHGTSWPVCVYLLRGREKEREKIVLLVDGLEDQRLSSQSGVNLMS